jgi:hypothetical protein
MFAVQNTFGLIVIVAKYWLLMLLSNFYADLFTGNNLHRGVRLTCLRYLLCLWIRKKFQVYMRMSYRWINITLTQGVEINILLFWEVMGLILS